MASPVQDPPEVLRTLQALHALRSPGWMFPAHFLGLAFEAVGAQTSEVSMPIGTHCVDGEGRVALAALGVLADVALAAALRGQAGTAVRLATLTMRLSFAARPSSGRLQAVSQRRFGLDGLSMPSAVATLEIRGETGVCCTGEASFAVLDNRRGMAEHPMPRRSTIDGLAPLADDALTEAERAVAAQARAAAARAAAGPGFLDAFWQLLPEADAQGAACRLAGGLHVSNRVGHLQGGVMLGLVAQTCAAAAPPGWPLLDLSAQYIAPGTGPWVQARASAVRTGRNSAAIECRVHDAEGRTTLGAQATFMRPAHAPAADDQPDRGVKEQAPPGRA